MNTSPLHIMLRALRLPSVLANYEALAATAASNNWGFEQYLRTLLEIETEDRARRRLGTKVSIDYKNGKGKVTVMFYSDDDLQRFLEALNL